MPDLDSSNVRVAVTGAVYAGPTTTTEPTDAEAIVTGFDNLGYVGEDGVTETRDRSSNQIRGWQHGATVREVVTEGTFTLNFVLLETKLENIELYYGGTVDPADGSIIVNATATGGRKSFIVDVIDDADFIRTYVKEGEVTEVGDQVYANGEPIGYEVTVTGYDTDYAGKNGSAKKFYSSLVVAAPA